MKASYNWLKEFVDFNLAHRELAHTLTMAGFEVEAIEEVEWQFENGDAFILYTDGITEAVNRDGEQYGVDRLEQFLHERWHDNPSQALSMLTADLISEVDTFAGFAHQRDDITFILGRTTSLEDAGAEATEDAEESVDSQTVHDEPDPG